MKIITATLNELEQIANLFNDYRQFYRKPSDIEGARTFLRERIENNQSVIFMAISPEGKPAGFTQLYPSFSSVSMKRLWVLNDLYVSPDFRRMGVGELLIERARQLGKETNASALMLETEVSNTTAQALYDKTGFERSTDYYVYYLSV